MPSLGNLRRLTTEEMRRIWPREEQDLSPWVAENIDALNEVLNLQIEIEGREEYVGNFRIDLVGTDHLSQVSVVVENQFGRSNHDHLGKLITYSAAREAGIMIWIANEIQTAHRNTVDWLNRVTPEDMTFYGVELEVLQIDGSKPAPDFRVVAGTPERRRAVGPGETSPRNNLYLDFFDKLRRRILDIQPNFTRAKALPQSWWSLGIGRSGFSLSFPFTLDNEFRVQVLIDVGKGENNKIAFSELEEKRKHIEERIGQELVWDPYPKSRAFRIYLATSGTIDDRKERLAEIIEWAAPLAVKFREVFGPLVKNIEIEG